MWYAWLNNSLCLQITNSTSRDGVLCKHVSKMFYIYIRFMRLDPTYMKEECCIQLFTGVVSKTSDMSAITGVGSISEKTESKIYITKVVVTCKHFVPIKIKIKIGEA